MSFNEDQYNDLRLLGLGGLLTGSTLAALRHYNPKGLFGDVAQAVPAASGDTIEVPVPGQASIPGTPEFFEERRARKQKGKGKKFKSFSPGEKVRIENSEKRGFVPESLTNPLYLPAAVAALGLPLVGGNALMASVLKSKQKQDAAEELEMAKREFGEALVAAHSNRLPEDVKVSRPGRANKMQKSAEESSFAFDLEALASVYVKEAQPGPAAAAEAPGLISALSGLPGAALEALKRNIAAIPDYAYGALGLTGALALGAGAAGTASGYSRAAKTDEDAIESKRYLNEFLSRRSAEGRPVYSVPVSVKVNKNKRMKLRDPSQLEELET
jgi:hypothetical protein